jgi:transposase
MEQINQIAELDYNHFVDENTGAQQPTHIAKSEQSPVASSASTAETYLIDRYKYAVRHIRQGLSVEEACNKYRISKGALLKCLSGGTAPRGKKTRLTESEENEIVEWLINNKDLRYNEAIHLVFEQVGVVFWRTCHGEFIRKIEESDLLLKNQRQ